MSSYSLPFVRKISKEERGKIKADVASRQLGVFYRNYYDGGRIYWTVDFRNEDSNSDRERNRGTHYRMDKEIGEKWGEAWLLWVQSRCELRLGSLFSMHLEDIVRDMVMCGRWGGVEDGFIQAISRHLVKEFNNHVARDHQRPAENATGEEDPELTAHIKKIGKARLTLVKQ